ncbi:hypothetical protein [Sphingomonas sp.]|uniref:hypothetical protein n=1 Tax=Sphingomonas sp. TaxID=28214 RepID=UPI003B00E9D4
MSSARNERLLWRASRIRAGKARGVWMLIAQHLALRGETEAMVALADHYAQPFATKLGYFADPFSAFGLYRRAYRQGNGNAAYNLAMSFFARRDMARYHFWLRRAARAGETDAALPFRRFELRRPHAGARRIGRIRPQAKRDELV